MNLKSVWAYAIYAAILNNFILKLILGLSLVALFDLNLEGKDFLSFGPLFINAFITRFAVSDKHLVKESEALTIPKSFGPFYKISLIVFIIQLVLGELISLFLLPILSL
tara:strand:- start:127 stop:453 length:327 start_codon:yes stop_codon:yes gene_type:complete